MERLRIWGLFKYRRIGACLRVRRRIFKLWITFFIPMRLSGLWL